MAEHKIFQKLTITSAVEMAEVFNDYFATIGSNLGSEIQPSSTEPEFYLQPTDTIFSLKTPGANITLPGCTFADLEQATNSELINLYSWLKANKLSLNIGKTEFMVVSSRQKFLTENCRELNIQFRQPTN